MAALCKVVVTAVVLVVHMIAGGDPAEAASWCVARSDASDEALQAALDYACGSGADCAPIQSSGLCYLPNTFQAHASYAFNSFYQRKAMAPGTCDFAGTATVARTDPSYGSCVYPSSPSTAGGGPATPGTSTTPGALPPPGTSSVPDYGTTGVTPGLGPVIPNSDNSKAPPGYVITRVMARVSLFLVLLSFVLPPM